MSHSYILFQFYSPEKCAKTIHDQKLEGIEIQIIQNDTAGV